MAGTTLGNGYPVMNKANSAFMEFTVHRGRYNKKHKYSITEYDNVIKNSNGKTMIYYLDKGCSRRASLTW